MTPDFFTDKMEEDDVDTGKRHNTGGSVTVIMHDPEATWGGDTCHAAASHGPGATHQPHVPHNVTFPRLPQQEHRKRGGQRQRRERSGQRSANRN